MNKPPHGGPFFKSSPNGDSYRLYSGTRLVYDVLPKLASLQSFVDHTLTNSIRQRNNTKRRGQQESLNDKLKLPRPTGNSLQVHDHFDPPIRRTPFWRVIAFQRPGIAIADRSQPFSVDAGCLQLAKYRRSTG